MQLALIVGVLAALAGLVRGGNLEALAATPLRAVWAVFAGVALQLGFDLWDPPWLTPGGALAVVLVSDLLVVAFLAANRRLPGMGLAAVGLALNVVVIAANGAMPVSEDAIRAVTGRAPVTRPSGLEHEPLTDDTVLPFLADVIPVPGFGIVSVGDVVLAAGIARLVYARTTAERSRRPATGSEEGQS